MAVNKVIYGGNTLVDLTGDTVTAADLAEGVKATGADGNPIVGLLPKVTIDSQLSASSTNPVQNKVIKAELDKKMAKTDKIYEANLEWGGRNIANGYSPIDAAMISELGANRFAFGKAAGITVEYSTDAGKTWLDYGYTDIQKVGIFGVGQPTLLGKSTIDTLTTDCMLRISIAPHVFGLYTNLNKFVIYAYASSRTGAYCTIDASIKDTPTVFKTFANKVPLYGGPAWNIINTPNLITYSNAPSSQFGLIRFTFGCTAVNTELGGVTIERIMAFGGVGWRTPSNMARNGHLYKYDTYQNAVFPANVTALNFIGKVNGFTIEASVPANAKFTDTVYTHPATHPASMITGLSTVATSGSYNDLTDKPNIPASAIVDSELSATSVNPVQNKVINAALSNKVDNSALSTYLPLTGGTVTGSITASNFQTGTGATSYFQCRKFRGEGDANSYYHAIDFGYSGHDSVDFYEYDPNWNFYKCLTGTKSGAVLVGNINGNGWNGGAQLTGTPTAPTAAIGTNTTQIATTAFVQAAIPTNVSSFTNDAGYVTTSGQNTWSAQQVLSLATLGYEQYRTPNSSTNSASPSTSAASYYATGAFTLNLATLSALLGSNQSTVFTAHITASGDYALSITNGGTIKYIGAASDLAITSAGLLLNILMTKDSYGSLTSIVQANKLT